MAENILTYQNSVPAETCHPQFWATLRHYGLEGKAYFQTAIDDQSPLTDLRVRRDDVSLNMAILNLNALQDHGIPIQTLVDVQEKRTDEVTDALYAEFNVPPSGRPLYTAPVEETIGRDPHSLNARLHSLISAFSGWGDAQTLSLEIHRVHTDPAAAVKVPPSLASTAGLVLALKEHPAAGRLLEHGMRQDDAPLEIFFTGFRWASIQAKRSGNAQEAKATLSRALSAVEGPEHATSHPLVHGLSANLRALLALRAKDLHEADNLMQIANSELVTESILQGHGTAEEARYAWMVLFNKAQYLWFVNEQSSALEAMAAATDFARQHDHRVVCSSAAAEAVYLLQCGDPKTAKDKALIAVRSSLVEYDPSVVNQIVKILLRSYLETDDPAYAALTEKWSPYFWRNTELLHELSA